MYRSIHIFVATIVLSACTMEQLQEAAKITAHETLHYHKCTPQNAETEALESIDCREGYEGFRNRRNEELGIGQSNGQENSANEEKIDEILL